MKVKIKFNNKDSVISQSYIYELSFFYNYNLLSVICVRVKESWLNSTVVGQWYDSFTSVTCRSDVDSKRVAGETVGSPVCIDRRKVQTSVRKVLLN